MRFGYRTYVHRLQRVVGTLLNNYHWDLVFNVIAWEQGRLQEP